MCVIINSIEESMPEPGVGVTLKPVAAESEFIVVLFRFPGELLVERPPGNEFMLSAELNWLANIGARFVEDSIDQCESKAETKLSIGQLSNAFIRSLLGRSCLIIAKSAVRASQCWSSFSLGSSESNMDRGMLWAATNCHKAICSNVSHSRLDTIDNNMSIKSTKCKPLSGVN